MRHIITLSTIPPRFDRLGPALTSLLRQRRRPEAVNLYIPKSYRRFPQWGGVLPEVPEGVTIVRVEEDLGPATKILPAARAYRGQDIELIYTDDDRVLGRDWTTKCLNLRQSHPGSAICGAGFSIERRYGLRLPQVPLPRAIPASDRSRELAFRFQQLVKSLRGPKTKGYNIWPHVKLVKRSGFIDIAQGYGGVMVRPEFLDDQAYRLSPVIWAVDDIWLSGHLTRNKVPIWIDRSLFSAAEIPGTAQVYPLLWAVLEGADRDAANLACIEYMRKTYGIWGGEATQST